MFLNALDLSDVLNFYQQIEIYWAIGFGLKVLQVMVQNCAEILAGHGPELCGNPCRSWSRTVRKSLQVMVQNCAEILAGHGSTISRPKKSRDLIHIIPVVYASKMDVATTSSYAQAFVL